MSGFKLKTGDIDFTDRNKKVFDQLLVLENNRKNDPSNDFERTEIKPHRRPHRSQTRHLRGKESIFKKPQNPAPKNYINKIPDFKKNPHKWTKYSMEDVQDVTDESNTKSAMDFLKELANRRKIEQGMVEEAMEELPTKIVFNRHIKHAGVRERSSEASSSTQQNNMDGEKKPLFRDSKLVMPEYVVGQKIPKKGKRVKKSKPAKGKQLQLDHLMFEDN